MSRVFLPVSGSAITGFVASINAALAPILTQSILSVQFDALDKTRHPGREYQLIITHDAGTATLVSPYQVVGFEGMTPDDVANQMAAWVAAHPTVWISAAFTVGLPATRFDNKQAGFLFYSTDSVNAPLNWAAGGGSGGGTGDHTLLTNRDAILQHPARAVIYDDITFCPDATATVIDTVAIKSSYGCATIYEFWVVDAAAPNIGFCLGRFSFATGPAGANPATNRQVYCAGSNAVPGLTFDANLNGSNVEFRGVVSGLPGGAYVSWRRISMTAPV